MNACPGCKKYHREASNCPFCGLSLSTGLPARLALAAAGVLMAACNSPPAPAYGGPPLSGSGGEVPRMAKESVAAPYGAPPLERPAVLPDASIAAPDAGVLPVDAGAKKVPVPVLKPPPEKPCANRGRTGNCLPPGAVG